MKLQRFQRSAAAVLGLVLLSGCSVAMETSRPTPVNMHQFVEAEPREHVTMVLGPPEAVNRHGCDVYRLYTRGPNDTQKGAIAATEAVADVLTLGLAEIVATPMEATSQSDEHTVTFCYDSDDRLLTLDDVRDPYALALLGTQPYWPLSSEPSPSEPSSQSKAGKSDPTYRGSVAALEEHAE